MRDNTRRNNVIMTFILDRLNSNSEDGTGRIEQLETELERVGKAFEDYIATTEGLETDVKKELDEMRKSMRYPSTNSRFQFEYLTPKFCF